MHCFGSMDSISVLVLRRIKRYFQTMFPILGKDVKTQKMSVTPTAGGNTHDNNPPTTPTIITSGEEQDKSKTSPTRTEDDNNPGINSSNTSNTSINTTAKHRTNQLNEFDFAAQEGIDKQNNIRDIRDEINRRRIITNMSGFGIGLLFSIIGTLLISAVCGFVIFYLEDYRKNVTTQQAAQLALTAELLIKRQIDVTFSSLLIMKEQVRQWGYSIQDDKFNQLATNLHIRHPEVSNFEYALGKNYTLSYIYPPLPYLIGIDMGYSDVKHVAAIERALREKKTTIYGPISLVEGGVAVIAQHPIFYPNDTFYGLSVELFYFDKLFEAINLTSILQNFQYQLYEYDNRQIFLESLNGDGKIENRIGKNTSTLTDALQRNMTIQSSDWMIILYPIGGWQRDSLLWLEVLVAVAMILVVACLTMATGFKLVRDCCLRKEYNNIQKLLEVEIKNRTLQLEQKRNQWDQICEAIVEKEKRATKIINSLADALITVKFDDGVIIHSNTAFCTSFGFTPNDVNSGTIKVTDIIPQFNIDKEYEKYLSKMESSSELTSGHMKAFTKEKLKINVKISISFSSINASGLETEQNKSDIVCVMLIHTILDQSISQVMEEKQAQYDGLKDSYDFLEMLNDPERKKEFEEYCTSESKTARIAMDFLYDLQNYKSMCTDDRRKVQSELFSKFLSCVSLSGYEEDKYVQQMSEARGQLNLFDEMEKQVTETMSECFKKWKNQTKTR